jgi:hypothetical protein
LHALLGAPYPGAPLYAPRGAARALGERRSKGAALLVRIGFLITAGSRSSSISSWSSSSSLSSSSGPNWRHDADHKAAPVPPLSFRPITAVRCSIRSHLLQVTGSFYRVLKSGRHGISPSEGFPRTFRRDNSFRLSRKWALRALRALDRNPDVPQSPSGAMLSPDGELRLAPECPLQLRFLLQALVLLSSYCRAT